MPIPLLIWGAVAIGGYLFVRQKSNEGISRKPTERGVAVTSTSLPPSLSANPSPLPTILAAAADRGTAIFPKDAIISGQSIDADGNIIYHVGKWWYDRDGNVVANIPALTPAEAIAKSKAGGYGSTDEVAAMAGGGLRKAIGTLPVLGPIIAGNIDTSNGALSPSEIMHNNEALRELATVGVIQDQLAAGTNRTTHGVGWLGQLDPELVSARGGGDLDVNSDEWRVL